MSCEVVYVELDFVVLFLNCGSVAHELSEECAYVGFALIT